MSHSALQTLHKFRWPVPELDLRCLTPLALGSAKACISALSLVELPVELVLIVELVLLCLAASTCGDTSPLIQWKSEYAISNVSADDILESRVQCGSFS